MDYHLNGYAITLHAEGWVLGHANSGDLLCPDCAPGDMYADLQLPAEEMVEVFIAARHSPEHPPICQQCERRMETEAVET